MKSPIHQVAYAMILMLTLSHSAFAEVVNADGNVGVDPILDSPDASVLITGEAAHQLYLQLQVDGGNFNVKRGKNIQCRQSVMSAPGFPRYECSLEVGPDGAVGAFPSEQNRQPSSVSSDRIANFRCLVPSPLTGKAARYASPFLLQCKVSTRHSGTGAQSLEYQECWEAGGQGLYNRPAGPGGVAEGFGHEFYLKTAGDKSEAKIVDIVAGATPNGATIEFPGGPQSLCQLTKLEPVGGAENLGEDPNEGTGDELQASGAAAAL